MYVPLFCKSNYSFLEGASHPDELIETAHLLGLNAIALTDRNGVYGVVQAHFKAQELGIQLLIGSQVTVDDGSDLILIAQSREGYANLCGLLTHGRLNSPKGQSSVSWGRVVEHSDGVIALWGGANSLLAQVDKHLFNVTVPLLKEAFRGRLYALVMRHLRPEEVQMESRVLERAHQHDLPVVGGNEVLYHTEARRPLQDVLTCIRHKTTVRQAGRLLKPNSEHSLKTVAAMNTLFQGTPDWLVRTREIAGQCTFNLGQLRYRYPSESLPDGTTTAEWLITLTIQGAHQRYGAVIPGDVRQQIDRELHVITELEYCGYFLTMAEIVRFCNEQNILCQGRGSAANSAVCYCLGITAVDPVRMGLLFERFLSMERAEPPDIDLDIAHERREEVIQHVYQKYGRAKAAMVANVIRYRTKSALRDVGKALGFPETGLDRISRLINHHDKAVQGIIEQTELGEGTAHHHLVQLVDEIKEFPRHLSIHPGGFLLGHEPVHSIVPIENATMPGRTVIQWDKYDVEALGLFKVDLLGLGALSQLDRCFHLIRQNYAQNYTMATIPPGCESTYQMIQKADTVGVFQIESRAQMTMLPRLRPQTFYDLVIEISIIRPGPITGGMVHPYLRRRHGEESVIYPHESLEPVLKKTLGVPIFQEQVMRLAIVAADYTPGEADQLRRDMAAWRRTGRIEQHRERLITRMRTKGIDQQFAEQVFAQIRGFGEYGFPESHAASFALIAYATAWLKCHYPEAFVCSLLNAQPMGFYTPATIIDDARRHGVVFQPIDINQSDWECSLTCTGGGRLRDTRVRMGARYIKGLKKADWLRVVECRKQRPFETVMDMMHRTGLDKGSLTRISRSGALKSLEGNRRQALWSVLASNGDLNESSSSALIDPMESIPEFAELDFNEMLVWDYGSSHHSVRGHPLSPLRGALKKQRLPDAYEVSHMPNGKRIRYAGLVICRQRPGTASGVTFMTLEDESGFVNVVVWQQVFERFSVVAKTARFLGVTGRLQVEQKVVHLVAESLWEPELHSMPVLPGSRDFR